MYWPNILAGQKKMKYKKIARNFFLMSGFEFQNLSPAFCHHYDKFPGLTKNASRTNFIYEKMLVIEFRKIP